MITTRRITYKLKPKRSAVQTLHWARKMHADVYNAALSHRKTQYKRFGVSISYFDQQNSLPSFKEELWEYKQLGFHTLQASFKRVDFAFQRFFKGLAKYPKFKTKRKYRGWTYPDSAGWKAYTEGNNGYLELKDLGLTIQMRGKARTWGKTTTCTIIWDSRDWYASITVKCDPVRETGKGVIGLDFGSKTAIATSDGEFIETPRFQAKAAKQEKSLSKGLRRKWKPEKGKTKASRRWKKLQRQIRQVKRKVANQRHNWSHQVAAEIVSSNSLVATEKLNLKGMTKKGNGKRNKQKTRLNRNLLDVGIGMTKDSLKYKVEEAGGIYTEVPTQKVKPTQRCHQCWELTKKTLSDRVHDCQHCRCQEDRDINAAKVMIKYARGQELSSSDGEPLSSTSCGSMAQLGAKKRQKPQAQR